MTETVDGELVEEGAITPVPTVEALLARIDQDSREKIDWVVNQMANLGLEPRGPGKPWTGRGRLADMAVEEFEISKADALELVDLTVLDLSEGNDEADRRVRRRLLMRRMSMYRELILQNVRNKTKELVYEHKEMWDEETGEKIIDERTQLPKMYRRLKREVETTGFDAASMKLLLEIEQMEIALQKLDASDADNENSVVTILEELDQRDEKGESARTRRVSVAHKIKTADIDSLSSRSQQIVQRALEGQAGKGKQEPQ